MKYGIRAKTEYISLARSTEEALGKMETIFGGLFTDTEKVCSELVLSGGKRLRPILAFACSRIEGFHGDITPLMAMLELMHTASLVHDDVVDNSPLRRGKPTLNALYGSAAARSFGDLLLSQAMLLMKNYRGSGINELLSRVSVEMCTGELEQLSARRRRLVVSQAQYLARIKQKTAFLLSASCRAGAMAAQASERSCDIVSDFGLNVGIAFQLRDDILDFKGDDRLGKPLSVDLSSGIYTLPVILAAQSSPVPCCAGLDLEDSSRILRSFVMESGAIEATEALAEQYTCTALSLLDLLPWGQPRAALRDIAAQLLGRSR